MSSFAPAVAALWFGIGVTCRMEAQVLDSFQVGLTTNIYCEIFTAIPQLDGKVLIGGDFRILGDAPYKNLARLYPDGSVDASFQVDVSGTVNCLAILTNKQILAGGNFSTVNGMPHTNIVRLNADGTLDSSFNPQIVASRFPTAAGIQSVIVQSDQKILICGLLDSVDAQSCNGLCRLNADGSLDTTFKADVDGYVTSIALQSDGKILTAGSFAKIGGQSCSNFARLQACGVSDTTFQAPSFMNGSPQSIQLQADGAILVAGLFYKVDGQSHTNIVRLSANGMVDSKFTAQGGAEDCWGAQTLLVQADGKIVIGYDFWTLNGLSFPYLGRLYPDSSVDNNDFAIFKWPDGCIVFSLALQADGRMLVAGAFSKMREVNRDTLGRLITEPATQKLSLTSSNVTWLRGGTSPEVSRVWFECSSSGTNWTYLGDGTRMPGGWRLTDISIATNAFIRARGFVTGGRFNGSCWLVESVGPVSIPVFARGDCRVASQCGQFACDLNGTSGSTVVIDSSTDLLNWLPVSTNMLNSGPFRFSDSVPADSAQRFYRARVN